MSLFSAPLKAVFTATAALTLSMGAALADPVTFETASGPMELKERPESVAVLDVAAVDTLAALGVVPDGIVRPLYVNQLEDQVAGSATVGTMFEADFEKLAMMHPDLIIVGGRALAQANMLSRIAPVADMSIGDDAIVDGFARIEAYGRIFDREDRAAELEAELQAGLDAARAAVASHGGRAMIVMTNGPKISAFGAGSRFGWMHSELNWPEAVEGIQVSNHGEPISFEYIAQANPDTLLIIDRGTTVGEGAQGAAATLNNPLVQGTEAWKSGRVIYLSTPEAYVGMGGVQSLLTTLGEITDKLSETDS